MGRSASSEKEETELQSGLELWQVQEADESDDVSWPPVNIFSLQDE